MDELELFGRLGWRRTSRGRSTGAVPVAPSAQAPGSPQWRWEKLNEVSAQIAASKDTPIEARQTLRMQRYKLAALATLLQLVVFFSFVVVGLLPIATYAGVVVLGAGFFAVFYWAFRSGLNLRFADQSLTMPMMIWALATLLYAMYGALGSYELISILYLLPFFFGTLRLRTAPMIVLAAVMLAIDLLIAMTNPVRIATSDLLRVELLRWVTLAVVLMWFAFMGGFLSDLRSRLNEMTQNLIEAVDAIQHLATHDELTGVFNRRQMVEMARSEVARAERYNTPWSVCMIDIDFFKRVNDTLGHAAGDVVLREFAKAVERTRRPTDSFGRYGGEEFILVLAQTRLDQARLAGERVRHLAEMLGFAGLDADFRITVSVGIADYRPGEDWQTTIHRADEALYRAKQGGRNRVELALDYESTVALAR